MQHIVKMCREAKALHTRPNRLTSWVHLDHWPIAWRKRKRRAITQRADTTGEEEREYVTEKVWIIRPTGGYQDCWHTPHPFHDSSKHEARAGLKHQNFATSVDVPQSQHLCECVVPQVAEWQGNTSTHSSLFAPQKHKLPHQLPAHVLTHQIFPGSRPWYIIARMRQDGFRIVTVFSYLDKHKMGTADNSSFLSLKETPSLPWEKPYFFFFFLMYLSWAYSVLSLNVELLSISCWMISCRAHTQTHTNILPYHLKDKVSMTGQKPTRPMSLQVDPACCIQPTRSCLRHKSSMMDHKYYWNSLLKSWDHFTQKLTGSSY